MKKLVKNLVRRAGFDIVRPQPARTSLDGFLRHLKDKVKFANVYDGGAAWGDFTVAAINLFPDAHFTLFEPLTEYADHLTNRFSKTPTVSVINKALLSEAKRTTIFVHPDLVGSSMFHEVEGEHVDGIPREIQTTVLDDYLRDGPALIKLDLQGAELDALRGAQQLLSIPDEVVVIMEVSLFENMIDCDNRFSTVISFMADRGYCLYDVCGYLFRPLDGALMQMDCVFCKEHSLLRADHAYATAEQRRQQFTKAALKGE